MTARATASKSAREQLTDPSKPRARTVAEILSLSGLTTGQVARLFGVPERTVLRWIRGTEVAPRRQQAASAILTRIQALSGSTPQERRAELLDSSSGTSVFHQLIATRDEPARLQFRGATVRELLDQPAGESERWA